MLRRIQWLGCLSGALLLAGCASWLPPRRDLVSSYKPRNVYCPTNALPAALRRVAVLPMTREESGVAAEEGVANLEPLLVAELRKRNAVEVIPVAREELQQWTGQPTWRAESALPTNLFQKISDATGCDAVLFCRLTVYRPHPPLAVGLGVKLITCPDRAVFWSVDEVFDASSAPVVSAAESYGAMELNLPSPQLDGSAVLLSPRRFGQYAAHAVMATLPGREVSPKASIRSADNKR